MRVAALPRRRALFGAGLILAIAMAAYAAAWSSGSEASGSADNESLFGQEVSPQAEAILEDGEVTDDELLQALDTAHDCIADKGYQPIRVDESTPPEDRQVGYTISGQALEDGEGEEPSDCAERHYAPVARAYDSQHVPADTTHDEYMAEVIACLDDKGFETNREELGDRAATDDDYRNALVECDSNAFR